MRSILEASWRKVPFSDEVLPKEPCLEKTWSSQKTNSTPQATVFVVEDPGERAAISLYSLICSAEFYVQITSGAPLKVNLLSPSKSPSVFDDLS